MKTAMNRNSMMTSTASAQCAAFAMSIILFVMGAVSVVSIILFILISVVFVIFALRLWDSDKLYIV